MKTINSKFSYIVILCIAFLLFACKTKKLAQTTKPKVDSIKKVADIPQPKPKAPEPTKTTFSTPSAEAKSKPQINVEQVKIQFDFDSSVLKTDSYSNLDEIASAMKMTPSVAYILKGFASNEGTKEHNLILSEDRANAVKTYLVNAGVYSENLKALGYGTTNPIGDNNTEAGRILNRRVEFKGEEVKNDGTKGQVK